MIDFSPLIYNIIDDIQCIYIYYIYYTLYIYSMYTLYIYLYIIQIYRYIYTLYKYKYKYKYIYIYIHVKSPHRTPSMNAGRPGAPRSNGPRAERHGRHVPTALPGAARGALVGHVFNSALKWENTNPVLDSILHQFWWHQHLREIPSGKLTVCYWTWP
jgi:hypothetical protein